MIAFSTLSLFVCFLNQILQLTNQMVICSNVVNVIYFEQAVPQW